MLQELFRKGEFRLNKNDKLFLVKTRKKRFSAIAVEKSLVLIFSTQKKDRCVKTVKRYIMKTRFLSRR